jgi:hypothetical protein
MSKDSLIAIGNAIECGIDWRAYCLRSTKSTPNSPHSIHPVASALAQTGSPFVRASSAIDMWSSGAQQA